MKKFMKNFTLTICFLSVTIIASANYTKTGTLTSTCGTTWNYVIHPNNSFDEFLRLERIIWAINNACGENTELITF